MTQIELLSAEVWGLRKRLLVKRSGSERRAPPRWTSITELCHGVVNF
jgi:hypothetical protein